MIAWLEQRFGRFAIPHLVRALSLLSVVAFVLIQFQPGLLPQLILVPDLIRAGEVWRTVSFLLIPPTLSPLWLIFAVMFMWMIGDALEQAWGAFRLNLYYLTGVIGLNVAAFLFDEPDPIGAMFHLSLFFAFATFHPNFIIRLFFILPVPAKVLAWISAGGLVYGTMGQGAHAWAALAVVFGNYFLFFGRAMFTGIVQSAATDQRRRRFEAARAPESESFHACATCGATELTHPQAHFRVARDGREYCETHLPS